MPIAYSNAKDLGIEPKERLGFNTDEELELALLPLMQGGIFRESTESLLS